MSKRVYFNRYKGEKLPENTKLVGRGSRYGNPYTVLSYGREAALELYKIWLQDRLRDNPDFLLPLRGKNLACSCKLTEDCHADILLQKITEIYPDELTLSVNTINTVNKII